MIRFWPFVLILIVSAAIMSPALRGEFLYFDDDAYVTANQKVAAINTSNIRQIFSEPHLGQYVPLTLVFLAVERHFFGLEPLGYHVISLLFHLFNALLVYALFFRWTGYRWKALGVAALFAIHPLSVEPVAWISSTKDMLGVFFYLLAVLQYETFKDKGSARNYAFALMFGILALLSKSFAVSLPILIGFLEMRKGTAPRQIFWRTLPFVIPSVLLTLFNVWATPGALLAGSPLVKILNVFFAPLFYLARVLYPVHFSCIYPRPEHHPGGWPLGYISAPFVLAALVFAVWRFRKSHPDIFFGVMIFSILILPMLPFFRVGPSMVADRYAYLAATGIYFAIISSLHPLFDKGFFSRIATGAFIFFWFIILGAASFERAQAWRDGDTLLSESIKTYPWSAFSYYIRGNHYAKTGQKLKAMDDYQMAITLRPDALPASRALEELRKSP